MPHVQVPEGGVDSISTGALEPSLRLCAASRQPELDGLREEAAQVCGNAVCGNIELKRTNDHHQVHRRENSERSLKVLVRIPVEVGHRFRCDVGQHSGRK
jgi:hypothetical protein